MALKDELKAIAQSVMRARSQENDALREQENNRARELSTSTARKLIELAKEHAREAASRGETECTLSLHPTLEAGAAALLSEASTFTSTMWVRVAYRLREFLLGEFEKILITNIPEDHEGSAIIKVHLIWD